MATLEALQARIKKLQAQAEAIVSKKSTAALETIRALMAKHDLTTADIDAHLGHKKRGRPALKSAGVQKKGVARYIDPKTGATWTGHGRAPAWIAGAKDRSKYLVAGASVPAATHAAVKGGTGNGQPKGPQPAKYRHPETGATWSGRGPAPAWLAGEKDRNKFLIAGANAAGTNGIARKKTTAKKAGRKARA
ncbi:H-NS family nucleoid-associated regulatory protein [Paraburkholderia phymatum]|uniref:Histone family protein nucleoid-structuring protein H-NS n=1 Tax=Paraburkholderia phymatum (strain DSM 17167 / CIP 108236 / LMG 21445 / STM815) TaxID=391038 RepID=B2JM34_PARP8|nr:H-NS family nucleoid-associated regulatory protein [Paraburkholderia phymatum]ACC72724.1 histone family protein nucleoid-structuring protein H-NS [Paraburkholderia phymatum STM815]